MACYEATSHTFWLRNFNSGLQIIESISKSLRIFCHNSAAVFFSKNNKSSSASKMVDIKFLVVRDRIRNHLVWIEHICTYMAIANSLTKVLASKIFKYMFVKWVLLMWQNQGRNLTFEISLWLIIFQNILFYFVHIIIVQNTIIILTLFFNHNGL